MAYTAIWGLPFAGMLMSIALVPALWPGLSHRRMAVVTTAWCAALLVPQAIVFGPDVAVAGAWHALAVDYLPLMLLLLALYVAGGGILIDGGPFGTPAGNTALLAMGVVLAGVMGTTGAAMMLIRPLLRANAHRLHRAHLAIFFILLVANVGGGTSPLGDPPLFIGFIHGVPFAWPLRHVLGPLLCVALPLLAMFYVVDRRSARRSPAPPAARPLRIEGSGNLLLIATVVASVVGQGAWTGTITLGGEPIGAGRIVCMGVCVAATLLSLVITPALVREVNSFRWGPMHEVAVLFAGLLVTIGPVLALLAQGAHGPLAPLFALTTDAAGAPIPLAYFWVTGLLSGFLDNAPTYLIFFGQAGGNSAALTGPLSRTLMAISGGAVMFGGLSYIGNAPNLMVRAIAEHQAVRMPGFAVYVAIAALLLMPCFALASVIFFR